MTGSSNGIVRQRGATAAVVASLLVAFASPARASEGAPTARDLPGSNLTTVSTCASACAAQQALATALHAPIRIGSSRFQVGFRSSKLTIGWSLVF